VINGTPGHPKPRREMREEDDTPIPWSDELPPRIDEGEYDAVVLSAKKVNRFGLTTVEFRFRIVTLGSAFDARLVGYCGLGPTKHARIRPHSKMASWQRAISAFTGGSATRVTLRSFRGFWFTVRVETVTHDHRKQALPERDQYSVVRDIIAVVGKVSELPPDRQSPDGEAS
jgi:hypothetical protein